MIHLDTSFLIAALVRGSQEDELLRAWLRSGESLGISAVAWAEFLCGPVGASELELASRVVGARVPFEEEQAARSAELFNASGRRRGSLADCMIAATSIVSGASLATANLDDFMRLVPHGLELVRRPSTS